MRIRVHTTPVCHLIEADSKADAQTDLIGGVDTLIELQFCDDSEAVIPTRRPAGTVLNLFLKDEATYLDSDAVLTSAVAGAWNAPSDDSGWYTATLDGNTDEIKALLGIDGTPGNNKATAAARLVLAWDIPGSTNPNAIKPAPVTIYNSGYSGGETVPAASLSSVLSRLSALESASGGVNYLSGVTGYTGGSGNLDGVATTALSTPRLVCFTHPTDGLRFFLLRSGTDAEASPGIIRPDDFNASTNAKVYQSVA